MSNIDPISDLLIRIQNAARVRKEAVEIPFSSLKNEVVKVLRNEGFLGKTDPVIRKGRKWIRIGLKYTAEKVSVIQQLKRISRPGRRVYAHSMDLRNLARNSELVILSTNKGVMSHPRAIKEKRGGEVLLSVS